MFSEEESLPPADVQSTLKGSRSRSASRLPGLRPRSRPMSWACCPDR